jgi:hypothetical protein
MEVVRLAVYRNKALISALEELLSLAEAGEIQAVAAVVKFGCKDHRSYALGDYQRNPLEAVAATVQLKQRLIARI